RNRCCSRTIWPRTRGRWYEVLNGCGTGQSGPPAPRTVVGRSPEPRLNLTRDWLLASWGLVIHSKTRWMALHHAILCQSLVLCSHRLASTSHALPKKLFCGTPKSLVLSP